MAASKRFSRGKLWKAGIGVGMLNWRRWKYAGRYVLKGQVYLEGVHLMLQKCHALAPFSAGVRRFFHSRRGSSCRSTGE